MQLPWRRRRKSAEPNAEADAMNKAANGENDDDGQTPTDAGVDVGASATATATPEGDADVDADAETSSTSSSSASQNGGVFQLGSLGRLSGLGFSRTSSSRRRSHSSNSASSSSSSVASTASRRRRERHRRHRPSVPAISVTALFNQLQTASVVVVDCRSASEYALGHIHGALLCEHGRRLRSKTSASSTALSRQDEEDDAEEETSACVGSSSSSSSRDASDWWRGDEASVDAILAARRNSALSRRLAARDMMQIVVIGSNRAGTPLLSRLDGGYRFARLLLKEARVYSVQFLSAGFAAFEAKYPFLLRTTPSPSPSPKPTPATSNSRRRLRPMRRRSVSSSSSSSSRATSKSTTTSSFSMAAVLSSSLTHFGRPRGHTSKAKSSSSSTTAATAAPEQYPNEIVDDFLFLGNFWQANSAEIVQHLGITHIVNVGALSPQRNVFPGVAYLDMSIKDSEDVDLEEALARSLAFMQRASSDHRARVLVHCVQGVSRSATVVIWYLMQTTQCSLSAAYSLVLRRRPLIFPNRGFMAQLMARELDLYGSESVHAHDLDLLQHGLLPAMDRPGSTLDASLLESQ